MISSSSMTRTDPLRVIAGGWVSPSWARGISRLPVDRRHHGAAGGRERQRQREARPLPDRAVAGDRAAVLLDDAVGDREAEAGSLADVLGGEERIVDTRQLLLRDARSGVGHLDDGALPLR